MFQLKKNAEPTPLDKEIESLFASLKGMKKDSKEYAQIADQLVKLYKLKEVDSGSRISADTLATIGANILGILLIIGHERVGIITSKAMSFVLKPR